jgi:bromodomain and PHD finger-containing protein 1
MKYDFDVKMFCDNLRATKPPYDCPIQNCGKRYKSFSGIQFHMYNFDHDNPAEASAQTPRSGSKPNKKKGSSNSKWHHRREQRSPSPPDFYRSHARETLSYAESQRIVEVSLDGHQHRIDICAPLEIILQDEIDNQDNTEKEEKKAERTPLKTKGGDSGKSSKAGKSRKENMATPAPAQPQKLPEANFKVLDDYIKPAKTVHRQSSYYRYMEKSPEELDDEVEYDMDEEVM